jgi:hypothetical protein
MSALAIIKVKPARAPTVVNTSPVSEEAVKAHLGDAHLINMYDGVCGRKFSCRRCYRKLPEVRFSPLPGKRFFRGNTPLTALHPHCKTCRDQAKSRWVGHQLYSPALHRFWSSYASSLEAGANARSIYFGIGAEDLLGKYLGQDARCAMTGILMEPFKASGRTKNGKYLAAPSVDRIDSTKHYTPDNIQIVMWAVNLMKSDLPNNVFIEICHQVSVKHLI